MATRLIPLSQFYTYVRTHIDDVPDPLIGQNLRLSAIEFSERTKAWRHITSVELRRAEQAVVVPFAASIFQFETVTFNDDVTLQATQYTDFEHSEFSETAQPRYVTQVSPGKLSVVPFREGKLHVSCFLRPLHGSEFDLDDAGNAMDIYDVVPDFFLYQHAETIAAGALHRLFMMPRKPFTDDARAAFYLGRFNQGCDTHFASDVEGQHNAPMRAQPDWF